jgi:hypothetical protein
MKRPTRKDTINLRVWQSRDGITIIENIVGVVQYPMAIHRPLGEHQEIEKGDRSRYSGEWCVTHIPTGKSFGIRSKDWDGVSGYVSEIADHPALLMMTDETLQAHPMYRDLVDLHSTTRKKYKV